MKSLLIGFLATTTCFAIGFPSNFDDVSDTAIVFLSGLREAARNGDVDNFIASVGPIRTEHIINSLPDTLQRRVNIFLHENMRDGSGLPGSVQNVMPEMSVTATVADLTQNRPITSEQMHFLQALVSQARVGVSRQFLTGLGRGHVSQILSSFPGPMRARIISFIKNHMV